MTGAEKREPLYYRINQDNETSTPVFALERGTTLLERVNDVLRSALGHEWHETGDVARAVLQAIREPSKEMIQAGITKAEDCIDSTWDSGGDGESHNTYESLQSDAPQQIWQAMIDAALVE